MTRRILNRSFSWLPWAFLLACGGLISALLLNETDPLYGNNFYLLIFTSAPVALLLTFRFVYNLFAQAHSKTDRAGLVAAWLGMTELTATALHLKYHQGGVDLTAYPQIGYAMLIMLGVIFLMLGDLLRHYEIYRSGARFI